MEMEGVNIRLKRNGHSNLTIPNYLRIVMKTKMQILCAKKIKGRVAAGSTKMEL